ncbi:MAG: S1C family serine protease [Planctomycetota bacterium]
MKQPALIRIAVLLAIFGAEPALSAQTGSGQDSSTVSWPVEPISRLDSWRITAGEQKVRIGITMDTVSEALASQLGVARDKTVLITQVFDGMPAAKAGLERFDIVVAVDGKTPATGETIRKALAQKNPGDILKLEVLRKGARLSLEIAVEESEKAGNLSGYVLNSRGGLQPFARITLDDGLHDAQKALEKALHHLQTKQMDLKALELKIPQLKDLHLDEVGKILGEVKIQLGKIPPGALGLGYSYLPNEGGKFSVFLTPNAPNAPERRGPGLFQRHRGPRCSRFPSPPSRLGQGIRASRSVSAGWRNAWTR